MYAELIRLIDDKSLSLVRHEAADKGREALKILRDHYSGKSKPRIINHYTTLMRLRMAKNECVTDYIIRTENKITALRDAGENMSNRLIITMVLDGLPDLFKPLTVQITQNEDNVTFIDFKRRLRVYEEAEKINKTEPKDTVTKTYTKEQVTSKAHIHCRKKVDERSCSKCGRRGHIAQNMLAKRCGAAFVKVTHIKKPYAGKRGDEMTSGK